jgi:uncharacterized protein
METTLLGIPLWHYLAVACVSFAASIVGGLAGYGTGLLLPLALVPTVGPEPVVPIIGITALFTNGGRVAAFWRHIDRERALRWSPCPAPSPARPSILGSPDAA